MIADRSRVRIFKEVQDMALRHASADIVISSGGYNSMLEAMQGNATILCVPLRKDPTDEQQRHVSQLADFVDIRVAPDAEGLAGIFASALARRGSSHGDRRLELNMSGAEAVRRIVLGDLSPA
jgi:predicted glycosyltransferase